MDELTLSHELTLFRDFRGDTPGPSAADTEAARARLFDAMAGEASNAPRLTSSRRRWAGLGRFARTRFWAPVAAAAAVTAVAITMVLLTAPHPAATPTPKPPSAHPRHHASSHPAHGASKLPAHHGLAGGTGGKHAGTGAASSGAPGAAGGPGPTSTGPPTATTTTLTVSPEAAFSANQVMMTATVTDQAGGNLAGGTVTFTLYPNETVSPASALNVCSHAPVTYDAAAGDNVATCTYTPTSADAGTYLVRAEYTGYRQYERSDSAAAPLTVTAIATATTLTSVSPTEASPGQTVTLSAAVTSQAGDNLTRGTVTFYWSAACVDGVCTGATLDMCLHSPLTYNPATHDNVATCQYTVPSGMTPGTLDMQAEYDDPSGPYPESTSSVVVFTVES
jgi:hypothetical protein